MSYLTLILGPALLWWYALTPEPHWTFTTVAVGYFAILAAFTLMMATTFKDVVVMVRDLRDAGTTPPRQVVRLAAHMLAVAACMDLPIVALVIQVAYSALYETAQEMSHEPA